MNANQGGVNQFGEPIPNDENNEGAQNHEEAVPGEEESENEQAEDETDEDDETEEDDEADEEIQDLRRRAAEIRQTLADRRRDLSSASAQKTQKILQWFNVRLQPVAVPVAVGGQGGSGAVDQIAGGSGENHMPNNQQPEMRPSHLARLMAWARARPEWLPEYEEMRHRYAGFASDQEVQIYTFIRVLEVNGMAPPGLPPRTPREDQM